MRTQRFVRSHRLATIGFVSVALALATAGTASAGSFHSHHSHSGFSRGSASTIVGSFDHGSRSNGSGNKNGNFSNGHHDHGDQSDGYQGTVTALGTNSITVQHHDGTPVVYATTSTTTYFEGTTATTASALAVGEHVALTLTSTTPQTVTSVTIALDTFKGTVTGVSGNVISITGHNSTALTVDVSTSTTYTLGGAASTLSAVVNGDTICATGLIGSSASTLNALSVKIYAPIVRTHVEGTITALGTNSITVQGHEGAPVAYTTTTATTFQVGSSTSTASALAVGEHVAMTLTSTTPQTVTAVEIFPTTFIGVVTGVSGNVISITGHNSTALTVDVSTSTTYTLGGAASTLSAVVNGDTICATGLIGSSASTLNALSVKIYAPIVRTHVEGTITALGTNSITVQGHEGAPVAYTTTTATTFQVGSSTSTASALAVGEHVAMTLTSTTPQTVTAVEIFPTTFIGVVTGVSGNVITLKGHGSTTLTVNVSTSTTYTKHGSASSLSAVTNGSQIVATGLLGSNDTTLNATSVVIGWFGW